MTTPQPGDDTSRWVYGLIAAICAAVVAAAGIYLGINPTPPVPPNPIPNPPAIATVLKPSDLSVVGYVLMPFQTDQPNTNQQLLGYGHGVGAVGNADGTVDVFVNGYPKAWVPGSPNGDALVRLRLPPQSAWTLDPATAPRAGYLATYVRALIYGALLDVYNNAILGQTAFDGTNLFSAYRPGYEVSGTDFPPLIWSIFNGTTWTVKGAISISTPSSAQGGYICQGYATLATPDFSAKYLGGRRLLMGSGSSAGTMGSFGPGLQSVDYSGGASPFPAAPLSFYPWTAGLGNLVSTTGCSRDSITLVPNMSDSTYDNGQRVPSTNWPVGDNTFSCGVVNTPTKQGVLFGASMAVSGALEWYGNIDYPADPANPLSMGIHAPNSTGRGYHNGWSYSAGPNYPPSSEPRLICYDQDDYGRVLAGSLSPGAIRPAWMVPLRSLFPAMNASEFPTGFANYPNQPNLFVVALGCCGSVPTMDKVQNNFPVLAIVKAGN